MSLIEDLLITLLFGVGASFTHPGIFVPTVESTVDSELKNVVRQTQTSREARETLGTSERVWKNMTQTLTAGNDQLGQNKHHLLPKIWDLVLLGRNLLAAREKAQNLAAEEGFDAEVRRLLSTCIEKASKPIPPSLDKPAHDKELQMKGGYKKVMITSLQFLNNLMTGNEARKFHVWLHLFGKPSIVHADGNDPSAPGKVSGKAKAKRPRPPPSAEKRATADRCTLLSAGFNSKYYKPGFLTDVPRLLQPDEIEPLLMILQSGIVFYEGSDEAMQAVRCKLLVINSHGRKLLREVLVFLGAWEVDEEDYCFRVLAQLVESILLNGLIPYAYKGFVDEKDVVTPAQSVLLKLLVCVYRPQSVIPPHSQTEWPQVPHPAATGEGVASPLPPTPHPAPPKPAPASADDPESVDHPPPIERAIPSFFVSVFRKQVLGPVIEIVQLQGAIRSGKQTKEAFELSLWDLDRIYEGVYQFLELFVLFSEDDEAKNILVERRLVADLVPLLAELDKAIPRYVASKATKPAEQVTKDAKKQESYMVERPFDIGGAAVENGAPEADHDGEDEEGDDRELLEPEEFTWPNVKRFIVILLSTLAWNNKEVQDLVREEGGLNVVLNQCKVDDDNPYIREHSILCIRALLQGNPENQAVVRELEAKEVVPSEVLDKHGYEPFIDEKGRVRLKRMEGDKA